MSQPSLYRWIWSNGPGTTKLCDVGIFADGSLRNPHGYPEDDVRAAVLAAD